MSLVKNKHGVYEADLTDRVHGRLHVSLRVKRQSEALALHSAVELFLRSADGDLVTDLRKRRINVQAIAACVAEQRPFSTLRVQLSWPTFGAAVDQYLAWMAANPNRAKKTHTQSTHYLTRAREFFGDRRVTREGEAVWAGEGERVDRITGERVDAFVQDLRARVSELTKQPLSDWSISLHLQKLGALYTWLNRQEKRRANQAKQTPRILHSPVDRDLMTKHAGGRVRFLSKDEAARLIAATPDQLRFPVLAGLLCGLRIGEVAHLRPPPHDLDLEHSVISVQPKTGWRVKTGKRREVPIPAELLVVVRRHLAMYASAAWMVPSPFDADAPLTEHALGRSFKRIADDAGLPTTPRDPMKVTFHTLRHTFASWLIMEGNDLFTVGKLMGHSSTQQVEDTYGHLSPDHKRKAMAQLGSWFGGLHLEEDAAA